jgi:peptidoglycan-associated lipoprotein
MKPAQLMMTGLLTATLALGACATRQPVEAPVTPTQPTAPTAPPTAPPTTGTPTAPITETVIAPVSQTVPGSIEDFTVNVGDRVYFDTDMHTLRADARVVLERQAAWLKLYGATRVLVAGNADERGTREYNLALGARRAESVRDFLIANGVPPGRIETVSYGKERPIDPRNNEDGWAINRNAQTQVVSGAVS